MKNYKDWFLWTDKLAKDTVVWRGPGGHMLTFPTRRLARQFKAQQELGSHWKVGLAVTYYILKGN